MGGAEFPEGMDGVPPSFSRNPEGRVAFRSAKGRSFAERKTTRHAPRSPSGRGETGKGLGDDPLLDLLERVAGGVADVLLAVARGVGQSVDHRLGVGAEPLGA